MNSFLDIVKSQLTNQVVKGVSDQLGLDEAKAGKAVGAALPLIMGALRNNVSTETGASSLLDALKDPRHSGGSLLNNLENVLGGDRIDENVMEDGGNILKHVFNGKENRAAETVGRSAGIDMDTAMKVLEVAAPFVMSFLGRKTEEKGVSGKSGLEDLLGKMLGDRAAVTQKAASRLQHFDDNDSTVDDIAGMILGGGGSKDKGLGGMLGGLFGKK